LSGVPNLGRLPDFELLAAEVFGEAAPEKYDSLPAEQVKLAILAISGDNPLLDA
jgi:hypothetical protein